MKAACLTLAMVGCAVLFHGTIYASSLSPALQEQSSEGSTKPLSHDHATDAISTHNGKRQKDRIPSQEQVTRRRTSHKNQSHGHANIMKANRPKQLRNGRESSRSENGMSVDRPRLSRPAVGAAKITNSRNLRALTAGVASVDGRQVKDPRNRGAAPAMVGGPANATGHTAAISGTGMNRRRLN